MGFFDCLRMAMGWWGGNQASAPKADDIRLVPYRSKTEIVPHRSESEVVPYRSMTQKVIPE